MRRVIAILATIGLLGTAAACGGGDDDSGATAESVTLRVFAAASLTDTFTEIASLFEAEHEGVTVEFNFAGSSDLVAQIQQGAPADVFASADEANMVKATDDDLVEGEPVNFASNVLTIVTPPDNPGNVQSLEDLARDDVDVVICAPQVPCGAATERVAEAAGIEIDPVSEESAVTDVLGKIVAGEADAGLVYVTDATGAGDSVQAIDFPESAEAVNIYPIAALSGSENPDHAQDFVDFVNGAEAQQILKDAGFGQP